MTCSGRGQICSALVPYNNLRITDWNLHSHHFNSLLWPSDAIWRHRSGPTLAQVMAWCRYPISQRPSKFMHTFRWRHNGCDGVSNHQPHDCLHKRVFRRRSKETSKFRVTGLCERNSLGAVNSPHKRPVTRKYVAIWWRHHENHARNKANRAVIAGDTVRVPFHPCQVPAIHSKIGHA